MIPKIQVKTSMLITQIHHQPMTAQTIHSNPHPQTMKNFDHSWQFVLLLIMFLICTLHKAITFISTKLAKSTTAQVTAQTPTSLQVKITLPTRIIFGDDETLRKFNPSDLIQLPKNRLGEGSIGTLYKVVLDSGSIITMRKICGKVTRGGSFEHWIRFFGGVRDEWLLPLHFGFWYGWEAFVIYDYLCLGSLEELLHGSEGVQFTPLNWEIREQIALGAAKAVASIHSHGLICGVIKSSNFLIQRDFSPRLSSYETPYLIPPSTIIRRNCGRMAPELTRTRSISKSFTKASDVYSFGILMLEIITGKKPSVTNLGQYVAEKRKREGLKGVPDRKMPDVKENVSSMIMIAGVCLLSDPKQRPSIGNVVEMIQAAMK